MVGYDLSYNTLDNNRNPTSGILAILRQDFAGVGGDVSYLRTTANVKSYYEVLPDVVGLLNLQGGIINGFGGKALTDEGTKLRMLDHFQMGPQLVRGFAPSGIGPRDLTQFNFNGTPGDALGGSMYWGASMEFQSPLYFLPKDAGVKVAVFADAGSVWNYKGPTSFPRDRRVHPGSRSARRPRPRRSVRSTTACTCVRRSAPVSCGRRRSDRSASTSRYRS